MRGLLPSLVLGSVCASAQAADLQLSVRSGSASAIQVFPGETVSYAVVGELSDTATDGLAMFAFDLAFSGGALPQANAPNSGVMTNFAAPLGLNNPAGYGGTVSAGVLRQVGGAQNTINNLLAPFPIGNVVTGVAQPGAPATLVTGSLTAPSALGVYQLSASQFFGNAIRAGTNGFPIWEVEALGLGANTPLAIEVVALKGDKASISTSVFEKQTLALDAGISKAGRSYLLLGSLSGTSPGIPLQPGLVLPLNLDGYLLYTAQNPNQAPLNHSLGVLDAQGRASASFQPRPRFVGVTAQHAFVLLNPLDFVSNPVSVTVNP